MEYNPSSKGLINGIYSVIQGTYCITRNIIYHPRDFLPGIQSVRDL
jgi:hypothetical protein